MWSVNSVTKGGVMGKKTDKGASLTKKANAFKDAVEGTREISTGYNEGLQAIKKSDRGRYSAKNNGLLEGSVDLDGCTKDLYPQASRWDYVIGYNGKIHFSEVHPASTGNVADIKAKVQWLEQWLNDKAPLLKTLPMTTPKYSWVCTDAGVHINYPQTSRPYRELAEKGLWPKKQVVLE